MDAKQMSDMGGNLHDFSVISKELFRWTFGSGKWSSGICPLEYEELDVEVTDRESSVSLSEHNDTRLGSVVLLNWKQGEISFL